MSSPPRDGLSASDSSSGTHRTITIPSRDGSPVAVRNRRSESESSIIDRPRLSPTLGRSFIHNDPESRERQRTLDADMARHLSRARQNSVTISPVASPFHSLPSAGAAEGPSHAHAQTLSSFSEGEEREFASARAGGAPSIAPTEAGNGYNFPQTDPALPLHSDLSLSNLDAPHESDLLFSQRRPSDASVVHTPAQTSDAGEPYLPLYQHVYSGFNFTAMEEFARAEKVRLGLDSPTSPTGTSGLRWMDIPQTIHQRRTSRNGNVNNGIPDLAQSPATTVDGGDVVDLSAPGPSAPRMRHRKISQSVPAPRSQRPGPGKKTALFEGQAGAPPPSLGLPNALPSFDHMLGITGATVGPHGTPAAVGSGAGQGHDRPYRFSFYSNALSATIHARSLAELPGEGQTFEELFLGAQRSGPGSTDGKDGAHVPGSRGGSGGATPIVPVVAQEHYRRVSLGGFKFGGNGAGANGGGEPAPGYNTANGQNGQSSKPAFLGNGGGPGAAAAVGNGDANSWWLDVLSPTDEEMKMLSKVFSIHPLTTEDILMEETREKIELFRNYYLVCFRSFDQDPYSPTYLEPLNMYIIVFREGTLSFHFRATPHPQNVRRRIKQLKDYISVTSDWISYALIDDITDAFGPLIQSIEYEVDSIDELVLILKEAEQSDMLRRIGTCRKKVMGLLRLMGNKADVVKGLAKRCNENWRVAPTSDIGLYLSDIQDHLITMTQNLNHYEKILSRSHSNYLAQISIEMTEANNQINDVLSKMTALGTVLIPMNLITGLWGMNVNVPGQEAEGLVWFASILGGLIAFAAIGGYVTFRLMSAR